jgi:hypothetical protein
LRTPLSYDENAVVDFMEIVSKSVVKISTIRLVQNIFYQAVPVGNKGSDNIIDKDGLIITLQNLIGQPIGLFFQVSELIGLSGSKMFVPKVSFIL